MRLLRSEILVSAEVKIAAIEAANDAVKTLVLPKIEPIAKQVIKIDTKVDSIVDAGTRAEVEREKLKGRVAGLETADAYLRRDLDEAKVAAKNETLEAKAASAANAEEIGTLRDELAKLSEKHSGLAAKVAVVISILSVLGNAVLEWVAP